MPVWHVREKRNPLEIIDRTDLPAVPENLIEFVYTELDEPIHRVLDLTREYPVRFFLIHLPDETHVGVVLFHHIVTDGGGLLEMSLTMLASYHFKVRGEIPEWAKAAAMHAQAAPRDSDVRMLPKIEIVKDYRRELQRYPMRAMTRVAGTPGGRGRTMIRRVNDDAAWQAALRGRARKAGGTLTDLFLSASKLAVQDWNDARGVPADVMYHMIAINQRRRLAAGDLSGQANPMALIPIPSGRADRATPEDCLRHVIATREYKLARAHDLSLNRLAMRFTRFGKLFPPSRRYRILARLMLRPVT
ncbi:MAG: hypothetical protein M5R36_28240 [Deltaproteobacteria bacterium]|nr:hypothetical protein [Deltaproteobacteria bacterium]